MNSTRKKVLAISGSTRLHSANEQILKAIQVLYVDTLDVQLYNGISALPHFNPDIDDENVAETVKAFRELINRADGVIICTPEYVFSLPGALKNALEWTVSATVFSNKPVALIVASSLGEKAFESLILIMKTIYARIGTHATLLMKGVRSRLNKQGEISDAVTLQEIDVIMKSFIETMDHTE